MSLTEEAGPTEVAQKPILVSTNEGINCTLYRTISKDPVMGKARQFIDFVTALPEGSEPMNNYVTLYIKCCLPTKNITLFGTTTLT